MALSTAKAESVARGLKSDLEKRGFSVDESNFAEGRKLTIDSKVSIRIEPVDAVSKDIFGNDLKAFTPHEVKLAVADAATAQETVKIMMELGKYGFGLKVGAGATLSAAETDSDSAEEIRHSVMWPTKGA